MKRDVDLIRELLLKVEALDLPQGTIAFLPADDAKLQVEGYEPVEIAYHLNRLFEAGFISGKRGAAYYEISGLTWAGHEFLDTVRNPTIWKATKERANGAMSMGLAVVLELAKAEAKRLFGLA